MLDWSYALLEPDEQRSFEQLTLFPGGWTLEAAEVCALAVADSIQFAAPDVLAASRRLEP
jgi:predicted ATPase